MLELVKREIETSKVLEYAVFTNQPVYLCPSQSLHPKVLLFVQDVAPDHFTARLCDPSQVDAFKELVGIKDLQVTVGYKQHSFIFEVSPKDETNFHGIEDTIFAFKKPLMGTLSNKRRSARAPLSALTLNLRAEGEIATQFKRIAFITSKFSNLSAEAIGLFLERDDGVVLPGDQALSFRLYSRENLILDTSGRIARIDRKARHPDLGSGYLVVIFFAEIESQLVPNSNPEDRRTQERFLLFDQKSAFLSCRHPLYEDLQFNGPISDLSSAGLSFLVNSFRYPIVTGMIFRDVEIQLPFQPRHRATLRIVNRQLVTSGDHVWYRLGAELQGVSPELNKSIHLTIQSKVQPKVVDATIEDYDKLWEFFFETGFIYSDKRKQIQDYAKKLFHTYSALLRSQSPIVRTLVYKEGMEIKGHVSGIKFYDNAWIIQHLNALKSADSTSAARSVVRGIADFFLDPKVNESVANNYLFCFYRPNNIYPAMLFGEIAAIINNPEICRTFDFGFCLPQYPQLAGRTQTESNINCREANENDLEGLEDILVERGDFQSIRIEGLTKQGLTKMKVSEEFEKIGLYRFRKTFVAHSISNEKHVGFAVCNYASPGLNLSELTNSFRLFFSTKEASQDAELGAVLARKALNSYSKSEMPNPVLLQDPDHLVPAPFARIKTYRFWSFDTRYTKMFHAATKTIFPNIKELIKKYQDDGTRTNVG